MQSAWSDPRVRMLRQRVPHGAAISGVLLLLLVLCVSNSTVSAGWVPHSEVLTTLALIAAAVMGLAALTRVPWSIAVGLGLVAAPAVAYLAAYPALHAGHPNDPGDPLGLVG